MMTYSLRKAVTIFTYCAGLLIASLSFVSVAQAEDTGDLRQTPAEWREQVNAGTVRIITKGAACTCTALASDMAKILNRIGEMRILPVLGVGSLQGMADVLYLQGIDMSIVQADALAYIKQNQLHPNIDERVRYITKLHNSEVHIVAGPGINSLADLEGKTVSLGEKGSGEVITGRTILKLSGITVNEVFGDRDGAIEKVRRGEIDATFIVTGKPASAIAKLTKDSGLHLVPVEFTPEIAQYYIPSEFTSTEYPSLIPQGQSVPTVAVGEVLAVYNWKSDSDRYAKLEKFVDAFFDNFEKFLSPARHRKWKEVNLAAEVPGWKRFGPADFKLRQILARKRQGGERDERQLFATFVKSIAGKRMSEKETAELYRKFSEWLRNQ